MRFPVIRFSFTHVAMAFAIIAIGCAWYVDRNRYTQTPESNSNHPIAVFGEKHNLWSPSAYLSTDTATLEGRISGEVIPFEGRVVESTQGLSRAQLRQPSLKTLEQLVEVLKTSSPKTQTDAAALMALYLEAYSGGYADEPASYQARALVHSRILGVVESMLQNGDPDTRVAGALIAGNLFPTRELDQMLKAAFEREEAPKWHLAWAYYRLFRTRTRR